MRLCPKPILLVLALLASCSAPPKTWVCYYGREAPPEALQNYGVVVVDSAYPGQVAALKAKHALALAYVSLGELNTQRAQFAAAQAAGMLLVENPNWPGAWMVDVRDKRWHAMVIDQQAQPLVAQGYDGLFLDTVDSALHLEATDPAKFAGMTDGVVALIVALHERFPQAKLLLNGALPLAGRLRGAVQMVALESSLTTWDFATKTPRWRTADERAWVANRVAEARKANEQLTIYSLDYWDPRDISGMAAIYQVQRAAGFVPYVATIALDQLVAEPPGSPAQEPASTPLFAPRN